MREKSTAKKDVWKPPTQKSLEPDRALSRGMMNLSNPGETGGLGGRISKSYAEPFWKLRRKGKLILVIRKGPLVNGASLKLEITREGDKNEAQGLCSLPTWIDLQYFMGPRATGNGPFSHNQVYFPSRENSQSHICKSQMLISKLISKG